MPESNFLQAIRASQVGKLNSQLNEARRTIREQYVELAHRNCRIAELEEQLRSAIMQAIYDPLTGLVTRREMERQFSLHLAALERAEQFVKEGRAQMTEVEQVSVLFFDLNGLKAVNDSFGHKAGDLLIETFSSALLAHFKRGTDIVGRWGGDEFVVLLGGVTPLSKAEKIADEFLSALSEVSLQLSFTGGAPHTVPVRAAVGVSSTSDGIRTMEELIAIADERMYDHKNSVGERRKQ